VIEQAYGRLGRRLRRILVMLPYAIRNPGVSLNELSERFGVPVRDLIDDFNLVFMCGLPGYTPGDLIDVAIEDDRVWVSMADYFASPLRITPAEALTLYASGEALTQMAGMEEADALRRGLAKLGRALGASEEADSPIKVELDRDPASHLEALNDALERSVQIDIEYFSAGRGELTERRVEPWGLIAAAGRWYLVGLDHRSGEDRMFRVERIKSVTTTEEPAEIPSGFDPERYKGAFRAGQAGDRMSLEISPAVQRWFEEYYPVVSKRIVADGWMQVELVTSAPRWGAVLLLRLGAEARATQPTEIADEARALAERIASVHGHGG
jgi:proteasome accessory factor C